MEQIASSFKTDGHSCPTDFLLFVWSLCFVRLDVWISLCASPKVVGTSLFGTCSVHFLSLFLLRKEELEYKEGFVTIEYLTKCLLFTTYMCLSFITKNYISFFSYDRIQGIFERNGVFKEIVFYWSVTREHFALCALKCIVMDCSLVLLLWRLHSSLPRSPIFSSRDGRTFAIHLWEKW